MINTKAAELILHVVTKVFFISVTAYYDQWEHFVIHTVMFVLTFNRLDV